MNVSAIYPRENYHVFDATAPKQSRMANWHCDCGTSGFEPSGNRMSYKSRLKDRIRAHLKCRCPIWCLKTAKKKNIQLVKKKEVKKDNAQPSISF